MNGRLSFSNDFVDAQQMIISHEKRTTRSDQVVGSSDFEFSVSNYNMMAADELFSKGQFLPFKPNCSSSNQPKMTLREELLQDDDEVHHHPRASARPPKGPSRWKEFLGLKKSHIASKKADKKEEEAHVYNFSQEMFAGEGSNARQRSIQEDD
ncbi:hypothetical protein ACHQM5_024024 [Ranunculus cassubicifolius]